MIATYQSTGKRILFRRGESFDVSTNGAVTAVGPGLIGSYGSGGTAKITASFSTSYTPMLRFSGSARDWRVMDLEFDGTGTPQTSIGIDIQDGTKITLLRLNQHDIGTDTNKADPFRHTVDEWAIVDSVMCCMTSSPGATFGVFGGTTNGYLALMGNSVVQGRGTTQGHDFRLPGAQKAVISNNTLDMGPGFTGIDFHGYSNGGIWTGQYADKNIISDNKFIGGKTYPGLVAIGPQNSQSDERLRDFIIERNWGYASGAITLQCFTISASNITVRNNLCGSSYNSPGASLLLVDTKNGTGIEPVPNLVWVYNNSFYSATNAGATMIQWTTRDTNMVAKNNLAYAPNAVKGYDWSTGGGAPIVVYDRGSMTPTTAGNSTNSQMKNTNPYPETRGIPAVSWKPTSGYAIGGGAAVPVWSDFFRVTESGTRNVGAVGH